MDTIRLLSSLLGLGWVMAVLQGCDFASVMCEHVADYTTQRRRSYWANNLLSECKKADHKDQCMALGSSGIMLVGTQSKDKIFQQCLQVSKNASLQAADGSHEPSYLAMAVAVFGGGEKVGIVGDNRHGRDEHVLTATLDEEYLKKVQEAAAVTEPLAETDRVAAKSAVTKLWCTLKVESKVQDLIRDKWTDTKNSDWVIYDCYLKGEGIKQRFGAHRKERRKAQNACLEDAGSQLISKTAPLVEGRVVECQTDLDAMHFELTDIDTQYLKIKGGHEFLDKVQEATREATEKAFTSIDAAPVV